MCVYTYVCAEYVCVCAHTRGHAQEHVGIPAYMCTLYRDQRTTLNPQASGVVPWVLCMLLYKAMSLLLQGSPLGTRLADHQGSGIQTSLSWLSDCHHT